MIRCDPSALRSTALPLFTRSTMPTAGCARRPPTICFRMSDSSSAGVRSCCSGALGARGVGAGGMSIVILGLPARSAYRSIARLLRSLMSRRDSWPLLADGPPRGVLTRRPRRQPHLERCNHLR